MLASYSLIQLARPRPSSLRSILLDSSAVGRGLGQRGEMLVQRSKHVQGQKRWLSDEVPKEAPSSATEDASSSWETFRDVAGFLVLSIGSGGYLLWDVKDLGMPQKKKKKSDDDF